MTEIDIQMQKVSLLKDIRKKQRKNILTDIRIDFLSVKGKMMEIYEVGAVPC